MSFLDAIFDFFKKLFGKDGHVVQTILTDINVLYKEAQPIVAALSATLDEEAMLHPGTAFVKIQAVLHVFVADAAAVDSWVIKNSGLTLPAILQNAAVFALSFTTGVGILKDLQLAVQLAYSVYAHLNPETTGSATLLSLGKEV